MGTEIKICGLTSVKEAAYLNMAEVDYAGFVFYEGSKRNVSVAQAKTIMACLAPTIKKVAVLVSPGIEQMELVESAGFDLLQIHGTLTHEIIKKSRHPIWQAINVSRMDDLNRQLVHHDKIEAYVVDGAGYGSGQTFYWDDQKAVQIRNSMEGKKFVLAGGLNAQNVEQGMEIFRPDVVDVSTGVEGWNGKDQTKIIEFAGKVRKNES